MPNDAMDFENMGKAYGKPDIERLGIFIEAPYLNGKGYVSLFGKPAFFKGRNMMNEGRKSKCGTQHGYFDTEFKRLFEGEKMTKKVLRQKPKAVTPFMPTGPGKLICTPGEYFGCFSGNIEHFSDVRRPKPKRQKQQANFLTNPVKQGGPGYADICISKYPEHLPEPYKPKLKRKEKAKAGEKSPMITSHFPQPYFDNNPYLDAAGELGPTYVRPKEKRIPEKAIFIPTGPGKWPGGSHQGCFSPYPEWMPPVGKKSKEKVVKKYFYPQSMALKTMFTSSIIQEYTDFKVHAKNCNFYEPNYTKHLLD